MNFQTQLAIILFNGVWMITFSYQWFKNGISFEIWDYNSCESYFAKK